MTVNDVYTLALAFLSETPQESTDMDAYVPAWMNVLLQEALPYENAYREGEGIETLPGAPVIVGLSDEIPFNDYICRAALPYGLAANLWIDDDNDFRSQDFRGRFITALQTGTKAVMHSIEDVY